MDTGSQAHPLVTWEMIGGLNLRFISIINLGSMNSKETVTRLDQLAKGEHAIILSVLTGSGAEDRALEVRLNALGITAGKTLQVLRLAWADGPMLVRVNRVTQVAIRRSEAHCVAVEKVQAHV